MNVNVVERGAGLVVFLEKVNVGDAVEVFGVEIVNAVRARQRDVGPVRARDVVV